MSLRRSVVALCLGASISSVLAATGGSFADGGNTLVSALLMFLGNDEAVYILDKAEGNAAQISGHPAWGSRWDIKTHQAVVMDIKTNSFCSSGMHLPNGSFVSFGGNDGITVNGKPGSQRNPDGTGMWDSVYQDFDGRKSIRILNPCGSSDDLDSANCKWYDEPTVLSMKKNRWYAAVEPTGDGTVVILGGFVSGGYINRRFPDVDPVAEGGLAENSYEFFPARGDAQIVQFLVKTSGLNAYAHTYLMPSGKMMVQANHSTMLWDYNTNTEFPLPDMPNGVIRVYPASGAVAMLPLTPENNYTPTVLFCGGSDMPDDNWGSYDGPNVDPWKFPASNDCQRLTPEPSDGSPAKYVQDDDMLETRTMGQFVNLPDGTLLMINGGLNGTAGYADSTKDTPAGQMPFGPSLASGPVFTPAIYNPKAPKGSRWSNDGLDASKIPRLYHSSAILLPDASVMIAGSNPNADVNLDVMFPTEYRAEIFYPPYFSAPIRPAPVGVPKTLGYGGPYFNITIPPTSYSDSANTAAEVTSVVVVRGGYTTHAMNMGQRMIQLNNTYTITKDGTITLHVSQLPPNPNLFQPGPALLFVVINGVPSVGTFMIVGSGKIEKQPTLPAAQLPPSGVLDVNVNGGSGESTSAGGSAAGSSATKPSMGLIIGIAAGGAVLLAIIAFFVMGMLRKKREAMSAAARASSNKEYAMGVVGAPGAISGGGGGRPWTTSHDTDSSVFVPLAKKYDDNSWDPRSASSVNINAPYKDDRGASSFGSRSQVFGEYDPYSGVQPQSYADYAQHGGAGAARPPPPPGVGAYADDAGSVSESRPGTGYSAPQQQQQQQYRRS